MGSGIRFKTNHRDFIIEWDADKADVLNLKHNHPQTVQDNFGFAGNGDREALLKVRNALQSII